MTIYPKDIPVILQALYLAAEWEDSVIDSYGATTDPVFRKQKKDAVISKKKFDALRERLIKERRPKATLK